MSWELLGSFLWFDRLSLSCICLLFYPLASRKILTGWRLLWESLLAVELAMGFDLFSRGQLDDFSVWLFAESDVCFVRLVYLRFRAQEPGPRRKPHVYVLCVSSHCPSADSHGPRMCPCFCFLSLLRNLPPYLLLLPFGYPLTLPNLFYVVAKFLG